MARGSVEALVRGTKLLALDVDGVLTDGGVYVMADGSEVRRFDIKDGLGLVSLRARGIAVALVSASAVDIVRHRAAHLGLEHVLLGVEDKLLALTALTESIGASLEEVVYMGDDLADLVVFPHVRLACAPADAVPVVQEAADWVSARLGGRGAVRELCDLIIAGTADG